MDIVKFKDFRLIPDINTVRKEDIDDETYFSLAYAGYVSNSGLKWIDPKDGGSPSLFKNHPKLKTNSLLVGSAVHECLLQPESFELAPKIGKPGGKLGETLDYIPGFLKEGIGLDDAIKQAAIKADYYAKTIDSKIESVKQSWQEYQKKLEELNNIETSKERKILSDKDWDVVTGCLESCHNNESIMNLLHPIDPFGDPIEAHCEDAFFMDFLVTYQNKHVARIPFKMKADSYTIDYNQKIITLNDLKTTGKAVQCFMREDGSFNHYSYARQMAAYSTILWYYAMYNLGITKNQGWKLKTNMLVVETMPNYWSKAYEVNYSQLQAGRKMFNELMFRVGYCQMFGWDKEIQFE